MFDILLGYGEFMYIAGVSYSVNIADAEKVRYTTVPFKAEKKENFASYAPVTAALWGEKSSDRTVAFNYFGGFIPQPDIARPTNNPKNLDPIEADTQSGFRLSSLNYPIHCPCSGGLIMTKPIFAKIKKEIGNAKDKEYLSIIEKNKEYLFPKEEKIFNFLKEQKKLHPTKTIAQIVVQERKHRLSQIEGKQYKILDNISKISETLTDKDDTEKIKSLLETTRKVIFERKDDKSFKRKKFIELLEKTKIKDEKTKAKLMEIAETLPTSTGDEDAWFVKYGGINKRNGKLRSSAEIVTKLLEPSYTNTDHVHPWNRGGLDAVSNFWLMRARCNIVKTDIPFNEWLNEDKENRIGYIKQYLTDVKAAIKQSKDPYIHKKYDLYPAKLAKTIYYETEGEVDFTKEYPLPKGYDVPRPADNRPKKAA